MRAGFQWIIAVRSPLRLAPPAILLAIALSGCGQKGGLYIPQSAAEPPAPPGAASPGVEASGVEAPGVEASGVEAPGVEAPATESSSEPEPTAARE